MGKSISALILGMCVDDRIQGSLYPDVCTSGNVLEGRGRWKRDDHTDWEDVY